MDEYIFSNEFTRNLDAMIYTCGYENCAPGHSCGPLLRSGFMVHYVLHGSGIYLARGRTFHLGADDAFLICPGELISYEASREDPWIYTWIGMHGIKIEGYLGRTSLPQTLVFQYGGDPGLRSCHERLFQAEQAPRNRDLQMNSILYEYLYRLAEKFPNETAAAQEKKSGYVEEALKYIESAYCDPISVQDVADRLSLNRSYLHRLFKSITGVSIKDYLLDYRIRQACILLRTTTLPIHVVARSVSYADALYFSKLFHQKKGVSPSEYRERHL